MYMHLFINKKEICNINNDSSNITNDIISFYQSCELKDKLIKDINDEFVQTFTTLKNFDLNIDNKWNQRKNYMIILLNIMIIYQQN